MTSNLISTKSEATSRTWGLWCASREDDESTVHGRNIVSTTYANKVVCVHDRVDEAIEQYRQVDIPVIHDIGIQPVEKEDREMMVDVQER